MRLTFDFPAQTEVLEKIGDLAANAAKDAGFDDEEIGDIQLAVDEACTNTIVHGLKKDPTRFFQMTIHWQSDEIEIVIAESGEPFDIENVEEPDLNSDIEERKAGGLGIYFVKKLMDKVEYAAGENGTKLLRMIKRKRKP